MTNKLKIINDPVHGFIHVPYEILYDLIEHPYLQRLRRISQTGLLSLVYPGAQHTRFHHALGAMHLMFLALKNLKLKQIEISEEEEKAALIAILLHDIGHGPYSHALESILMPDMHHEKLSLSLMQLLNVEFSGQLSLAIQMFLGEYHRPFFHQLISSQLDVDRLDYLKRDSFFTGVAEGNINAQRIISMMHVHQNELVVEAKGIYSVENFLSSRMFMYWQVYFHKTNGMAESLLVKLLQRAKMLSSQGQDLPATPALAFFLKQQRRGLDDETLAHFAQLDDSDVMYSIKQWQDQPDKIMAYVSQSLVQRNFGKSLLSSVPFDDFEVLKRINQCHQHFGLHDAPLMVEQKKISLLPYDAAKPIKLWHKDGSIWPIEQSEHQILSQALMQKSSKYLLYYPNLGED